MVDEFQKVISLEQPRSWAVVDDTRFNVAIGGVRLTKGVTLAEVRLLAESMTLKLHSLGIPLSGAKGGVDSDQIGDFYSFIASKQISDLLSGNSDIRLVTGPDIGTSEEDYYEALRRADLSELIRPGLLSEKSVAYGLPLDNIVTAYGAVVVAEELLAPTTRRGSDPLEGKRFCIEGFGKVGTGLAAILNGRSIVVGISTKFGCISDTKGLNISRLLELQEKFGDRLIFKYGLDVKETDSLFSVSCDVLIPGARTQVISESIAKDIATAGTKLVVSLSNHPYTDDGLMTLTKYGITAFPDFISSSGAIIAGLLEMTGEHEESAAMDLIHAVVSRQTRDLLMAIRACGDGSRTMYQLAIERAKAKSKELLSLRSATTAEAAVSFVAEYLPHLLEG